MVKSLRACLLLFVAIAAAVLLAYGTNPDLGRFRSGLDVIALTRRLQWVLVALSIGCCLLLIGSVVASQRRAWWLIGLAPVVALFAHRFSFAEQNFFTVADVSHESMLAADEVSFLSDEDWVVGVIFDGEPYAYPYRALYSTPVVVHSEREKRIALIWSPFANHATVLTVDREFKARDLDVVSMPCNSTLIYNSRLGEFIIGITGTTTQGQVPRDVLGTLVATRTTWRRWKAVHPGSRVMPPMGRVSANSPGAPVLPHYALDAANTRAGATRVAIIAQGVAIPSEQIGAEPINLMVGKLPVVIFRDPGSGELVAYDRRLDDDLMPRFSLNPDRRAGREAFMTDADTGTGWSTKGVAVTGPADRKGQRLKSVVVQDDLYWEVMKHWYPGIRFEKGRG